MRVALLASLAALAGCSAPLGVAVRKTTPKPFTAPQLGTYRPEPPVAPLSLARPLRVAVLYFRDRRELKYPPVDRIWSRDAEGLGRRAQPREIRGIVMRGLAYGLGRIENLRLVTAGRDAAGREAEVFVSGEILVSRVSATFTKYRGTTELLVLLRDRNGRPLTRDPIRLKGSHAQPIYDRPSDWRAVEPFDPKPLAPTVEKSVEDALARLFRSEVFRSALSAAAAEGR